MNKSFSMNYRKLKVYQMAFKLAIEIHRESKKFPEEERYSLTNQIRKSTRSVCANLAEGYRKRRYRNHFINKLTDADSENSETMVWLEFSHEFEYIDQDLFTSWTTICTEIGYLLNYMIKYPEKFS